ncbi:MAG: hypothetical protein N2712_05665 [Brevinematales bacterium]|nr:hypothetical protein [Brevinematales bacterium]
MYKDFLFTVLSSLISSLIIALSVLFIITEQPSENVIRLVTYLLIISITTNSLLSFTLLSLKLKMPFIRTISFIGNLTFLLLPILLKLEDHSSIIKITFLLTMSFILHMSISDIFIKIDKQNTILNIFSSRLLNMSLFSILGPIITWDTKFSIISLAFVTLAIIISETNRYRVISKNLDYSGTDILLKTFSKTVKSINKKLEENNALVNALKLQMEIFTNSKKEILSIIESLKQNITEVISSIEGYEDEYENIIQITNTTITEYSTYILSLEYNLSIFTENINSIKKILIEFNSTISSKISKKEDIFKNFKETEPILDSLINKIDSVSEILTNIITNEISLSTTINYISDELSALNVISTNAQIESTKIKGSRTMTTIINEITNIQNNIRAYVTSMQDIFSKIKDLFDYISSTSQSLLKHSDRVKYNIGLINNTLQDVITTFSNETLKIDKLISMIENIQDAISSSQEKIRDFRNFLEKLTRGSIVLEKVKSSITSTKSLINEILISLDEIQQNVSES